MKLPWLSVETAVGIEADGVDAEVLSMRVEANRRVPSELTFIQNPEVEDGLAEALRDPDSQVRRDAVFAVVKLQQPCADIVNQLDAIRQEDSEPGIRDAATRALAKIRSSD